MRRWKSVGLLVAATVFGTVFQAAGCFDLALQTVTAALDTCSILNCTGGTFFNLCSPTRILTSCPIVP